MKTKVLALTVMIMAVLTACHGGTVHDANSEYTTRDEETAATSSALETAPYVLVNELEAAEQTKAINWESVLNKIPSDKYEQYNGLHSMPLTATLYKNGEVIELDVNDPRLIRLMNFYNNEIYYGVYSYSQGDFSSAYEQEKNFDFRLELTFTQNLEDDSFETTFDKIVVYKNFFVGIRSNIPFENYHYSAYLRMPLHYFSGNWLEIFGF